MPTIRVDNFVNEYHRVAFNVCVWSYTGSERASGPRVSPPVDGNRTLLPDEEPLPRRHAMYVSCHALYMSQKRLYCSYYTYIEFYVTLHILLTKCFVKLHVR